MVTHMGYSLYKTSKSHLVFIFYNIFIFNVLQVSTIYWHGTCFIV
jgi:hypothetical protein